MALTPEAAQLVELLEAAFPRVDELGAAAAREEMSRLREQMPRETEEVRFVEDRAIPGAGGDLPVRVYRPEERGDLPVLVYLHGGGWAICDLDTHDPTCRRLANGAGCVVLSVDYRLAPEHPFPAAADDALAALRWVADHGAEIPADASRLGVAGDSAGGNLAAAAALMARDGGGPPPAVQALVYPVIDRDLDTASYRENADGCFLTRGEMEWYWSRYLRSDEDAANPYAAPIRAEDHSGLPPAVVVTAEHDPLRDEGDAYARCLADAGVPVSHHRYAGMFHGFFGFSDVLREAEDAQERVCEALREAFAGAPA